MVVVGIRAVALRRPTLYQFRLASIALLLALQSVRSVALFVAAVTPVMITTYGEWWRDFAAARKWTYHLPPRRLFAVITAIVLIFIALVTVVRVANNVSPAHQQSTDA